MADELDRQIKAVEAKIAKVEDEIDEVKGQLKLVAQLEDPDLRKEQWAVLAEREKGLRKEKEDLRTKEHDLREEKKQLREKEKLLMAKQQQGAGCRSWPATILCARTLVACLLSCRAP